MGNWDRSRWKSDRSRGRWKSDWSRGSWKSVSNRNRRSRGRCQVRAGNVGNGLTFVLDVGDVTVFVGDV
jgi:hypothetical protein